MTMYSESLRAFLRPVLPYLDDEAVTEILINGPADVWIEKKGKLIKTDAHFSEEGLLGAARNMAQFVGRVLTDERPRMDARLPDGSRIHVVLGPVARKGTTISIRKFFKDRLTMDALVRIKSVTQEMSRFLEASIHLKQNMIVSGGTGSGKTTLLNIIASLIPESERILTIEDSAELQLNQVHLVPFESRPPDKYGKGAVDMGDLLNTALRMRPDRIVVGEVRGPECFHLMQAMNTGHGGSLSTTHANTPTDTLRRLETLCLMSTVDLPLVAVRAQVASAIHLIVCCDRLYDGTRKVTSISEVLPLNDKGEYRTQDLFVFTAVGREEDGTVLGYHAPTGIVPHWIAKARAYGFADLDEKFFDPATYGLPPPPIYALGEDVRVRWAPSLKHRERGTPDPEHFRAEWSAFERKLKEEARRARLSASPLERTAPAAAPPPRPATPAAAVKTHAVSDGDKTPSPSRNPFPPSPRPRPAPASPPRDEPSVQVSQELLNEAGDLETKPGVRMPPPPRGMPKPRS